MSFFSHLEQRTPASHQQTKSKSVANVSPIATTHITSQSLPVITLTSQARISMSARVYTYLLCCHATNLIILRELPEPIISVNISNLKIQNSLNERKLKKGKSSAFKMLSKATNRWLKVFIKVVSLVTQRLHAQVSRLSRTRIDIFVD